MIGKVLLQRLWLLKLQWDDPLPADILRTWNRFVDNLSYLSSIKIPRHAFQCDVTRVELHIFTDASQTAYGACAYVRTVCDDRVVVKLLISKGKVAPLKPVSIPRLELCGALLGAKLYDKIRSSLTREFDEVVFWTDSTIVLGWLRMTPNLLKTFVQNRVAEIHELTSVFTWRHVSGKENPADLISRGVSLEDLVLSKLWWEGPTFLHVLNFNFNLTTHSNSNAELLPIDLPELKSNTTNYTFLNQNINTDETFFPFNRFSNFNRMIHATAYVLRFTHNSRPRHRTDQLTGAINVDELNRAVIMLAKLSQRESFSLEYNLLKSGRNVKSSNRLSSLNLFLDEKDLMRVGGRIKNSLDFNYNKKHPILLCSKHYFTRLLFTHEHNQALHCGPQALLYRLREQWWPLSGRNLARKVTHQCVACTRARGKTLSPLMGNLPKERLTADFPFIRTGVDYAGPVSVLNRKGRGAKLVKSYICLFICFITRAIHLELVSDLSTDAYLLALKRFISRRGKPCQIFSDNGRNFVGLNNEFAQFLSSCSKDVVDYAKSQNIKFSFIPPYSPHFGGLWEAGIKSCKYHLRRVLGNAHLTFEEFATVLTQIEAVLNSRPLVPLSSDPSDGYPLSPGHFLIGRPLTAPVCENDLQHLPVHRLSRYQRVEQLRQQFWMRWAREYISELQIRAKWRENTAELKPDTLVLVKDVALPPLKWPLGRVVKTIPGEDGISRVADIKTASGVIRRSYTKICPLVRDE
ncbi:uncharacterized protein LOC106720507 [Papilio machaon]|uniref:uncharacterized protein LOC106720507 n=1 Tax=Papilio machaon TaxID=76193 RepID=UPI001E662C4C|nr:uncharacterized protein LOC106720507 [Papilio machaon]